LFGYCPIRLIFSEEDKEEEQKNNLDSFTQARRKQIVLVGRAGLEPATFGS
jgi:hypothetical protein